MIKLYVFLVALVSFTDTFAEIVIPDIQFKNQLSIRYDKNNNDKIELSEIDTVRSLSVNNYSIQDLLG